MSSRCVVESCASSSTSSCLQLTSDIAKASSESQGTELWKQLQPCGNADVQLALLLDQPSEMRKTRFRFRIGVEKIVSQIGFKQYLIR